MSKAKAFTLIELLVAISIIALLSSIVLASLNSARSKAKIGAGRQFAANVYHAAGDQAVGIWDFDEGSGTVAADRSGNGSAGTLANGAAWSADTQSGSGYSLRFDGVDDYVAVPDAPSLEMTGDMTISLWIKPASSQKAYTDILSKHSPGGYVIEQNGGNSNQFYFSWDTTGAGGWTGNSIMTSLAPGVWQHFAVVKSGASIKHYLNGAEVASGTGSSAVVSANNLPLWIGDWPSGSGRQFNGSMDDVRIFAKSLVAKDVEKLYAQGLSKHIFARE